MTARPNPKGMKNEIVFRVFDFLKEYPPFNLLKRDDLMLIAANVTVMYQPEGSVLFRAGDMPEAYFYIVNTGAVMLTDDNDQTIDICDEGEVFGLRALIAHTAYLLTAKAVEESVIYQIPTKTFMPYLDTYPRIGAYLAANLAAGAGNLYSASQKYVSHNVFAELVTIDKSADPIYCSPDITIQEGARIMAEHGIGSIIICDHERKPLGIITDKDLRTKVVAGDIRKKENITRIMSSPVICTIANHSIASMQIMMLKGRISHIAITQDGTPDTRLIGVVSEHDLVVQQADNPAIIIRQIRKSNDAGTLRDLRQKAGTLIKKYLAQEVSIPFLTQIITEINDEIIRRAIFLSEVRLGRESYAGIDYCWLALGSEGREEQLLITDQDNALIYRENPEIPDIKAKCLALAVEVTKILNETGFEFCPADMMASNPKWCQSVGEWKQTFEKWIYQPGEKEIMMCTIFFDYRPVYGNATLPEELTASVFENLSKQDIFLHLLARNALENPPPLSFFRNFIVEKNGEHKDSFDIKLRAMMPLADAARLLILSKRISGVNNTCMRFHKLSEAEPQNAELYLMAADAYELLIRFRALMGLEAGDSGRYIRLDQMNKMDRLQLRNAFQPIDELQKLIKTRFQLGGIL